MPRYSLKINGQTRDVTVEAETPLLWVLRDTLGLTGTKFGCGQSLCGACTVHLDGEPIRSCVTPVSEAARGAITTIEGLTADRNHPVRKAWIAEEVPQCGYCQPGMMMTAAALLAKNKTPKDQDIDDALAGHICRCGTYQRIRRAIHMASRSLSSPFGRSRGARAPEQPAPQPQGKPGDGGDQ
jgi:isoquinoline 1-oxidoreductase subunit alpha